jgi:hypothetical protein
MLLLLPVLLLIIAAIAIQVLGRIRFSIAQSWIFAIITANIIWISFSILRIIDPPVLTISYLDQGTLSGIPLSFHFNAVTWVFGFLLLTMLGAILLADSSRLSGKNNLVAWSGAMVITAAGILACMSGSLVAFILASTFLDISLLIVGLVANHQPSLVKRTIVEFSLRVAGTIVLIMTFGDNSLEFLDFQSEMPGGVLPFFLVGLILRMGVIHTNERNSDGYPIRRNLQVLVQMVVPVTMFAFISRLSIPIQDGPFFRITFFILISVALVKAIRLTFRRTGDQKTWIDTLSALAIGLFLLEQTNAILPLGIVMISIGGAISVTDNRSRRTNIALIILMLGMIGLPFTPSNGLWINSTGMDFALRVFFYNFALFLIFLGVTNDFLKIMSRNLPSEKWVDVSISMSPIILMISPWIFLPWNKSLTGTPLGMIIAGILIVILLTRLFFWKWWFNISQSAGRVWDSLSPEFHAIPIFINNFLKFKWLEYIFRALNRVVEWLVTSTIQMLEGDGGLLWALVFLILITSIIVTYRIIS